MTTALNHGRLGTYNNQGCRCEPCKLANKRYHKRYRTEKKRRGLCAFCSAKALTGRPLCEKHTESNRTSARNFIARRRASQAVMHGGCE